MINHKFFIKVNGMSNVLGNHAFRSEKEDYVFAHAHARRSRSGLIVSGNLDSY